MTTPKPQASVVDEIFTFGYTDPTFINDIHVLIGGKDKIDQAKQQLKQLILDEIIGKDDEYMDAYDINEHQNFLRDEQRTNLNQLFEGEL